MSVTDRVQSVPVECYGLLLSDIHPDDRGTDDMKKWRCRLIVVELNEPGYRLATLNDKVDDLYANQEALDRLNKEVYKVKPDWAQYIADSSMIASTQRDSLDKARQAATQMYAALNMIVEQGDEPTYLDITDLLLDCEDYAPEEEAAGA